MNVATGETIAVDLLAGDCVELDVADSQYRDADVGQWRQLSDLALCWQDGEPPVRGTNCSPPPITGDGECTGDIVYATGL